MLALRFRLGSLAEIQRTPLRIVVQIVNEGLVDQRQRQRSLSRALGGHNGRKILRVVDVGRMILG